MREDVRRQNQQSTLYDSLKKKEALPPDLAEKIHVVGLFQDAAGSSHLLSTGANATDLKEGIVTRGALLNAGYVFLNRIGGGEKPLINASVPSREGDDSSLIHMGGKLLLTRQDLDAVIWHQQANPAEFGTGAATLDEIRADMMDFFEEAEKLVTTDTGKDKSFAIIYSAINRVAEEGSKYSDSDIKTLAEFLKVLETEPEKVALALGFMIDGSLYDVDRNFIRGIPIDTYAMRFGILQGAPSPFLDSGFRFGVNYDFTLYPKNPEKLRRINMVVVHLLSRGLNEMGASGHSHDQRYITSGEYAQEIYPKKAIDADVKTQPIIPDDVLDRVAARFIYRARQYMAGEPF